MYNVHDQKFYLEVRTHFFEILLEHTLRHLHQSEDRCRNDPDEHPILLYNVTAGRVDHPRASTADTPGAVTFARRTTREGRDEMHISYSVPSVRLDGHVMHRNVLPIRNGKYHPTHTTVHLLNLTLNARLTYDKNEGGDDDSFEYRPVTYRLATGPKEEQEEEEAPGCSVNFRLVIGETERYGNMPRGRIEHSLRATLCGLALLETADFYGAVLTALVRWSDRADFWKGRIGVPEAAELFLVEEGDRPGPDAEEASSTEYEDDALFVPLLEN